MWGEIMKMIVAEKVVFPMWMVVAITVTLLSSLLQPAAALTKGNYDSGACAAEPEGCAAALGVDPSLLTFVQLKGRISAAGGKGFSGTTIGVAWESGTATEGCRYVIERLLGGKSFTTSAGGAYSIFVPACGSITYTLTPDNPDFNWTPASRSIRVSGASFDTAYKSGGTGGGKTASADSEKLVEGAIEGTPDTGEMAQVDTEVFAVEGRDMDSLTDTGDNSKGPLRGAPAPGYAELERAVIDAIWRATTGCDSLGDPLAGPSAMELAACADKPVSDRMGTAEQGRNDFNSIFGIGSSTSSGLTSRAAGDRGLPTLTTDSNGNPVLPTKEEIQAYLRGKQSQYSDQPGMTQQEAEEKITWLGTAIKWVGKVLKQDVVEKTGEAIEEAAPGLSRSGATYRSGHYNRVNSINEDSTPNPIDETPYQYSAKECQAICSGTSASNTQRQQCGCDDSSQGVKNPSGSESGAGTQEMAAPGVNMMKKKTEPLIHTTGPTVEKAPVEINTVPDRGGKGPNPDPATGKKR